MPKRKIMDTSEQESYNEMNMPKNAKCNPKLASLYSRNVETDGCGTFSLKKLLDAFEQMSETDQDRLMAALVEHCNKRQLSALSNIVSPLLKMDILRNLPYEIAIYVLTFLPVQSLCRLASTSRYYNTLVNDCHLWRDLCFKYNYELPPARRLTFPLSAKEYRSYDDKGNSAVSEVVPSPPRSSSFSSDFMNVDENNVAADTKDVAFNTANKPAFNRNAVDFKLFFKRQYVLSKNWIRGKCDKFSVAGEPNAIVTCLQFDDDIMVIATDNASYGLIEVFDSKHGRSLMKLTGHEGGVWALEFKGNTLVSGGCDRDLRIWDLSTGNERYRLSGHTSTVRCLKMIDETTVVTGSRDNTLRVWDTKSGRCKHVLRGHTGSVRCLDFHGNIVVSGSYDNSLRLWDIKEGKCLKVMQEHHAQIYSVAFNGNYICSGSLDADVRVWCPNTGECLMTLEGHEALVGHLQLKDDILVTGGSDGRICVWNVEDGELIQSIFAHRNSVTTLQFDKDRILSGGEDGIKMWNFQNGTFVRYLVQDVTGVWRLMFNETKLVTAVQKGENTSIEIMDFLPDNSL